MREPFISIRTQTDIPAGFINTQKKLIVESLMPSNGVIFSDGIEKDFLNFNSDAIATYSLANEIAKFVCNELRN